MKVKNNENYFLKKGTLKYVGVAMAALGFLLYYVGWGWISYIVMCTCLPGGAVLFIVGSSGRAADEDIDEYIAVKMRGISRERELEKNFSARLSPLDSFYELEGYELSEGLMFAKTKGGSVRSSVFTKTLVYILTDGLYLVGRSISLIDEEKCEDRAGELLFSDMERAEICEEMKSFNFRGNLFRVKDMRLKIVMKSGEEISIPMHDDLRSELIVERINREIQRTA
jgi:hypothetical protein